MSRTRNLGRRTLLAVMALLPASRLAAAPPEPTPSWEGGFDVASLVHQLGAVPERRARFREERRLAALDRPLESGGTLHWRQPDLLEKSTEWPQVERLTVSGAEVTLQTPGQPPRALALGSQPGLDALVDALRAPLAGDARRLAQTFDATLAGSPEAWALRLVPRDPRARRLIAAVDIRGALAEPTEIVVQEANGDEQHLRLDPL